MTYFTAIILGIVEGATEFVPVSSSGHLIIIRKILGENGLGGLSFDAVLQLSATLALVLYFWRDILNLTSSFINIIFRRNISQTDSTYLYAIVLGTIPAIVFGLLLEHWMDTVFRSVFLVSITLILGSILMWLAEKFSRGGKKITTGGGVLIGFFQCLALVPGVSRSGATISGGLLSGLSKDDAVRFSFVLSIPILLGSGLKKLFEIREELFSTGLGSHLLVGSICAFVVGLISINFLIKYLKNHSLNIFVWYRVILAIFLMIFLRQI